MLVTNAFVLQQILFLWCVRWSVLHVIRGYHESWSSIQKSCPAFSVNKSTSFNAAVWCKRHEMVLLYRLLLGLPIDFFPLLSYTETTPVSLFCWCSPLTAAGSHWYTKHPFFGKKKTMLTQRVSWYNWQRWKSATEETKTLFHEIIFLSSPEAFIGSSSCGSGK